jgi:hypothetical protein
MTGLARIALGVCEQPLEGGTFSVSQRKEVAGLRAIAKAVESRTFQRVLRLR